MLKGRAVRTKLVRENKVVKYLFENPKYDFNYQFNVEIEPEILRTVKRLENFYLKLLHNIKPSKTIKVKWKCLFLLLLLRAIKLFSSVCMKAWTEKEWLM